MAANNMDYWVNPLLQNESYWSYLPNALPLNKPEDFLNFESARMYHTQNYMNPSLQQYYDSLDAALRSLGIPFEFETVEAFTPSQPAFRKYRIPGLWDNMPTLISPTQNMTVGGMAENIARQYYGNSMPNLDEFIRNTLGSGPRSVDLTGYHQIEGSKAATLVGSPQVQPYLSYYNDLLAWVSGPGFKTSVSVGPGGFTEWRTSPWNAPQFPSGAFSGYGARGASYNTTPVQQQTPSQPSQTSQTPQQAQPNVETHPQTGVRIGNANTRQQVGAMPIVDQRRRSGAAVRVAR